MKIYHVLIACIALGVVVVCLAPSVSSFVSPKQDLSVVKNDARKHSTKVMKITNVTKHLKERHILALIDESPPVAFQWTIVPSDSDYAVFDLPAFQKDQLVRLRFSETPRVGQSVALVTSYLYFDKE